MGYYVAPLARPYDVRVLIDAYVLTKRTDFVHSDFTEYYRGLLSALESLFGVSLSGESLTFEQRVLWGIFENTVSSLLRVGTPWDSYLEEGLVVTKLRESGDAGRLVTDASRTLVHAARLSQAAHRAMLLGLFNAIFGPCDRVVSSEDLGRAGFDDSSEPNISDYWEYM